MTKTSRAARKTGSYRRRKRQRQGVTWLPWVIGGAIVLVVAIVVGRSLLTEESPGKGARAQEWLSGVAGTSYDAGPTEYAYPDPAGLGDGHQWLPALGEEDAPVVVMEVSDVFCGHCRDFNLKSLAGILEDYVATGKVRYVDHYFGFANTVQQGTVLAEMCAAEQGRYFEFKHALFQSLEIGDFDIDRAARLAGLDASMFRTCREEQRYNAAAQEMAFVDNEGVKATPAFFVNGKMISGNLPNEIRQAIDAALVEER